MQKMLDFWNMKSLYIPRKSMQICANTVLGVNVSKIKKMVSKLAPANRGTYPQSLNVYWFDVYFLQLMDITSFKMMAYGKPEIDPTDITFTITHVLISLTATSAQMLITMIPNMIPAPVSSLYHHYSMFTLL